MDNYLESLILKKSETNNDNATQAPIEEVALPGDLFVDNTEDNQVAEPEIIPADPAKEALTSLEEQYIKEDIAAVSKAETKLSNDTMILAKDIKVFHTPDPKGPFKIFTGNVIPQGQVSTMTQIKYMKPGFGLVKGFTPDI